MAPDFMEDVGELLGATLGARDINQSITKKKLANYKKLSRSTSDSDVAEAVELVDLQLDLWRKIKELAMTLQPGWSPDTDSEQQVYTSIAGGIRLLNELLSILTAQKLNLSDAKQPIEKRMQNYRTYVKQELSIYSQYERLGKQLPSALLKEAEWKKYEQENPETLGDHVGRMATYAVLLFIMGSIDKEWLDNFFGGFNTALFGAAAGGIIYYRIRRYLGIHRLASTIGSLVAKFRR